MDTMPNRQKRRASSAKENVNVFKEALRVEQMTLLIGIFS